MEPRNYESGAAGLAPTAPVTPSTGYPTDGDPQTATPPTKPGAHWFYKIGESLRNVITSSGLTPDDGDLTIFQQAIVKLVGQSNHVVRLESVTFNVGVADGNAVYWDNANSRYDKAIADGTNKQDMVGFADVTNSLVEAFGRSDLFTGLTPGAKYYLSDITAGAITLTAPTEKVIVGLAKSATALFVDIDPDSAVSAATEVTAGVAPVATQALVDAGVDDAAFVTSKKLRWGFSTLLATNGYIAFPSWLGGLILQWCDDSQNTTVGTTTLPLTFPNAILHATISDALLGSSTVGYFAWRMDISNTSEVSWQGNSTLNQKNIFVIGY